MHDFGVAPEFLCCRRDDASCRISGGRILGYTLSFRLSVLVGVRFFSRMVYRLAKIVDANELLNWVFTRGVKFPTKALASAVAGYVEDGREEDAMRIVMPFPHFEESVEAFRRHPQVRRKISFTKVRKSQFEPHHASYALMKLYISLGNNRTAQTWAEIAMTFEEQYPLRMSDIKKRSRKGTVGVVEMLCKVREFLLNLSS